MTQPLGQENAPTISQLGSYTLLGKLGEGAMAVVFLAEDTMLKRKVAVKILSAKLTGDPSFLARFQREAQAAGKLSHANIAGAYAVGEERGLHYYVMEYCEGETLDHWLKRSGRLDWRSAVKIARQIAEGLQYAHKLGFVHRDIKPANIMLSPEGVAKILDLGLSKNIQQDAEAGFQTMGAATIGTPHYISPEQARGGKSLDGRADIYSLGATLHHLVTGSTLFTGETSAAIAIKHVTDPLPNAADLVPNLPGQLLQVMGKMMAREPENRYPDCGRLIRDLDAVLASVEAAPSGKRSTADAALSSRPMGGGTTTRYAERAVASQSRRRDSKASGATDPRMKTAFAGAGVGLLILCVIAVTLILSRNDPTANPSQRTAPRKGQPAPSSEPPLLPPTAKAPEQPPPVAERTDTSAAADSSRPAVTFAPRLMPDLPPRVVSSSAHSPATARERAQTQDPSRPAPRARAAEAWDSVDIGTTGVAGRTDFSDEGFSIRGAGADIWLEEDAFHFAYQRVQGDAEIVAQVVSLKNTHEWAKAGVMIRETLETASKHALMAVSGGSGMALQYRPEAPGLSESIAGNEPVGAPHWVRLVRTGDRLSGSASQDGVNWKQTGTLVIRLPENVYVGLAVCSHVQGSTTTAEFRHVSVTGRSGLAEATKGGVSTVASSPVSTPAPDRSPLASPALKQSIGNGASVSVDLGSGVKMEFVRVEAGTFTMGGDVERQSDWQAEERPRHKVTISKPFYLGKYPVTVAQFSRFVDATRYQTECEKAGNRGWVVRDGKWGEHTVVNWRTPGFDQTPEHPVVLVTWNDARAFVVWASQQTGRRIGLPTEAQREWAARGPKDLEYPFGQTWDPSKANHRDQALRKSGMTDGTFSSIDDGYVYTSPVGKFDNASWCGAYDLSGNVWQWVEDRESDYTEAAQVDPVGPSTGNKRILRGGSWNNGPTDCRAAFRQHRAPDHRSISGGFRAAMVAPE